MLLIQFVNVVLQLQIIWTSTSKLMMRWLMIYWEVFWKFIKLLCSSLGKCNHPTSILPLVQFQAINEQRDQWQGLLCGTNIFSWHVMIIKGKYKNFEWPNKLFFNWLKSSNFWLKNETTNTNMLFMLAIG
jgi:hypothetical protein